jgi:hypothetical protein
MSGPQLLKYMGYILHSWLFCQTAMCAAGRPPRRPAPPRAQRVAPSVAAFPPPVGKRRPGGAAPRCDGRAQRAERRGAAAVRRAALTSGRSSPARHAAPRKRWGAAPRCAARGGAAERRGGGAPSGWPGRCSRAQQPGPSAGPPPAGVRCRRSAGAVRRAGSTACL